MQKTVVAGGSALGLVIAAMVVASMTCYDPFATESRPTGPSVSPATFTGLAFHSVPDSRALATVSQWQSTRPADAAMIDRLARTPQGTWFNGWQPDPRAAAASLADRSAELGALPIIVVYNIPLRDCGEHSAGGAASAAAYQEFVQSLADGIRGKRSIVVLEPDAVSAIDCLNASARDARNAMLRGAVRTLMAAGAWVYIDAGHWGWHSESGIASRLRQAGIDEATGFALNVSNFVSTENNVRYGDAVSGLVGGKHYIIDTSRNGLGPAGAGVWCNPPGRAIGEMPTTTTGRDRLDALAWIKNPGDSDGPCNGGPAAGEWWPEYALGLMQRAK